MAHFLTMAFNVFNMCRGRKDAVPKFLSGDKERAPCLCAIVSEPKWPLHHPACDGIHLRKIIIEDVDATRLQIWMYLSLISQSREGRVEGSVPLKQYTLIHQEGSHWLE